MPSPLKLRVQPDIHHIQRLQNAGHLSSQAQHIGIIVLSGHFGHIGVCTQGRPDSLKLVGGNTHSDPRGTDQYPSGPRLLLHMPAHLFHIVGIADNICGVRTQVDDLNAFGGKAFDDPAF